MRITSIETLKIIDQRETRDIQYLYADYRHYSSIPMLLLYLITTHLGSVEML